MCALCGVFGQAEHWSDAPARDPGLSSQAERRRRIAVANPLLAPFGLKLTDWAGRFTLSGPTGRSAVVEHFGAIWQEADKLRARPCDPLDPAVLTALEARDR
ncbi:hypothetical protein [Marinivivus vitaminiproducens]|uniref:hypothetical protein n=1 Tax=Marinivivus vitaminiproducens TaxID=3035935 RepID=UPI0027A8DE9B|nr:hypothetical protein P4R82_03745 [Geminicoccaceae bacterium SCSIO 64248]